MNLLSQCAGISGVILVFYGLLALGITQSKGNMFFWSLMGLGFLCLVYFLFSLLKNNSKKGGGLKTLLNPKAIGKNAGGFVYGLVCALILLVINVQSQKFFNFQKDFTKNKVFTLSDQTATKLRNLKSELKITAFMDERNPEKAPFKELLQRYASESKNVKVQFIDADKDKLMAEGEGAKDGDVVVEYAGKKHVTRTLSEEGITQAMIKASKTSLALICLTQKHGEMSLETPEEDPRSISYLKLGLENEGFLTKSIDIQSGVEDVCDILFVAGPTQNFSASELDGMETFLNQGKKMVLLLDPQLPNPKIEKGVLEVKPTGFEDFLSHWGVEVGTNLLLEKQLQLFQGQKIVPVIRAAELGNHPIVDSLKTTNASVVFDRARSVTAKKNVDTTVIELIKSAPEGASWAIANVDSVLRKGQLTLTSKDIKGPVTFAVAVEKELKDNKRAQLVVFGDSDFVSNNLVRAYEYNFDLVLNTFSWLSGDQESVSIRPKMFQSSFVELTPEKSNTIFYITIVLIPMVILMFGLNLWWVRKQRG